MIKDTPGAYGSGGNTVPPRGDPSKGDPVTVETMFRGWEVTEEDLVQYKDMQRRGLQFLFSAVRKQENTVIYSPMNKLVSVYQKPDEGDENAGDYVVVSMSGNNPNDIRVMDITNEYVGDTDRDPTYLIQKAIEMADDSGMLRYIEEFGEYGKTSEIYEFADTVQDTTLQGSFTKATGSIPPIPETDSKIKQTEQRVKNPNKFVAALKSIWAVMSLGKNNSGMRTVTSLGSRIVKNFKGSPNKMAESQAGKMELQQLKNKGNLDVAKVRQDKDFLLDPTHAGQKGASIETKRAWAEGKRGNADEYAKMWDKHIKPGAYQEQKKATDGAKPSPLEGYKFKLPNQDFKVTGVVDPIQTTKQQGINNMLGNKGMGNTKEQYMNNTPFKGVTLNGKKTKPIGNMGAFPQAPMASGIDKFNVASQGNHKTKGLQSGIAPLTSQTTTGALGPIGGKTSQPTQIQTNIADKTSQAVTRKTKSTTGMSTGPGSGSKTGKAPQVPMWNKK